MKEALLKPSDGENHAEEKEVGKINVGTIVSNLAHPYTENNSSVLITTYAHFTPPLMVVIEKNYGVSYNSSSGEREDNTAYKCLYYSTINGSFELNWFKNRELKIIKDNDVVISSENKSIESLKKEFLGRTVVLTTVDLELDKVKIWSENNGEFSNMKTNNLLDFLPPLASIIDVKLNDDYKKYNEKNGSIIHHKSKILIKVRWLNNITSKYSEEYIPLIAIKIVEPKLEVFSSLELYLDSNEMALEENEAINVKGMPLRFIDVIWKHYYYIYRFKNLFTNQINNLKEKSLEELSQLKIGNYEEGKLIFDEKSFNYVNILSFFKAENIELYKNKWFEIEYLDKGDKYSRRIIYINELIVEDIPFESVKKRILLKCNCLLREGKVRHFYVDRIVAYRLLPENFKTIFVK